MIDYSYYDILEVTNKQLLQQITISYPLDKDFNKFDRVCSEHQWEPCYFCFEPYLCLLLLCHLINLSLTSMEKSKYANMQGSHKSIKGTL